MDLKEEFKTQKQGYQCIVGLDEAGRGALAGPVVAAAVCFQALKSFGAIPKGLEEVNDSKKLSFSLRERLYQVIVIHPHINWSLSWVGPGLVDRLNVLEATRLAMKRAVDNFKRRHPSLFPDFLLLDGKTTIDSHLSQRAIVGADGRVFSCGLASIIAKVSRDRMMASLHRKYPQYGFALHKGYGTKEHRKMIEKYGPCKIHRKSFGPVKNILDLA